jgi:hypothetical protein
MLYMTSVCLDIALAISLSRCEDNDILALHKTLKARWALSVTHLLPRTLGQERSHRSSAGNNGTNDELGKHQSVPGLYHGRASRHSRRSTDKNSTHRTHDTSDQACPL